MGYAYVPVWWGHSAHHFEVQMVLNLIIVLQNRLIHNKTSNATDSFHKIMNKWLFRENIWTYQGGILNSAGKLCFWLCLYLTHRRNLAVCIIQYIFRAIKLKEIVYNMRPWLQTCTATSQPWGKGVQLPHSGTLFGHVGNFERLPQGK